MKMMMVTMMLEGYGIGCETVKAKHLPWATLILWVVFAHHTSTLVDVNVKRLLRSLTRENT